MVVVTNRAGATLATTAIGYSSRMSPSNLPGIKNTRCWQGNSSVSKSSKSTANPPAHLTNKQCNLQRTSTSEHKATGVYNTNNNRKVLKMEHPTPVPKISVSMFSTALNWSRDVEDDREDDFDILDNNVMDYSSSKPFMKGSAPKDYQYYTSSYQSNYHEVHNSQQKMQDFLESTFGSESQQDDIPQEVRQLILEYANKPVTPASLQTLIRTGQGEEFKYASKSCGTSSSIQNDYVDLNHKKLLRRGHRLATARVLMQMSNFLRHEIPIRLAHRIYDLDNVPYMKNVPAVQDVKQIYIASFLELLEFQQQPIYTACDEERFATLLTKLYQKHANVLIQMAKGAYQLRDVIQQYRQNLPQDDFGSTNDEFVDELIQFEQMEVCHKFLDRFYLSRIGIRVLVGQYLALRADFEQRKLQHKLASSLFQPPTIPSSSPLQHPHSHDSMCKYPTTENDYIGMICQRTNPVQIVKQAAADVTKICRRTYGGRAPMINIEGNFQLTFPYIPTYLHYVLIELLKNAVRATMERHASAGSTSQRIPPVTVIIADGTDQEDVVIKIMDEGGGIPRSQMSNIWSYLYTTADPNVQRSFLMDDNHNNSQVCETTTEEIENNNATKSNKDHSSDAPLAGLGYGLPISRDYCKYFGGELDIISMEGFGTDAFIHLKRLGDSIEPVPL